MCDSYKFNVICCFMGGSLGEGLYGQMHSGIMRTIYGHSFFIIKKIFSSCACVHTHNPSKKVFLDLPLIRTHNYHRAQDS